MSEQPVAPDPLERGRYALYEAPDGSWVVARAVDTCETCRSCGCGDAADNIVVPAMVVTMAKAGANGTGPSPMKLLKAAMGR